MYLVFVWNRVWHTGTGDSRYREFFIFIDVSEPVSEKIGTGKKSRNRYRKKFGTGKSTGIGIENIWYRKKYRYRYRSTFWVPSHTASGMRNIIPVRYSTVFLQNPGIPAFFGTVLALYFHPRMFWELFDFFFIGSISDQFREFPQLLGLLHINKLPKKKKSSSQ